MVKSLVVLQQLLCEMELEYESVENGLGFLENGRKEPLNK